MPSKTEQVAQIIERRSTYLTRKIDTAQKALIARKDALYALETHTNKLVQQVNILPELEYVEKIDTSELRERIDSELLILSKLKSRFNRQTLNIGVMGLMGQGKSTLLKSLSGLTNREIPAYEGAACTAVRSMIYNNQGSVQVQVVFHSEKTFLAEVILPYYTSLELNSPPRTIDEFANTCLPSAMPAGATDEAIYHHLRWDYLENLREYRHLIVPGADTREQLIAVEDVGEYVRQERNHEGKLINFKHLAVREVNIFCPFNNSDVGKIVLVDIPGLGDSKLGDEKVMVETLGKAVDVVLFITRPDPQRYQWRKIDTDLYDLAAQELNNLAARAFMVINHSQRTNNLKACEVLKDTLSMKVVACDVVDCSDTEDAHRLFERVINYLTEHILDIDEEYTREVQGRLGKIQRDIDSLVQSTSRMFTGGDYNLSTRIDDKYDDLFGNSGEGWWRDITIALQNLRREFYQMSRFPSYSFASGIENVYKNCQENAGILTHSDPLQEINRQIKASDPMTAYAHYRDSLRTLLSDHFSNLDEGLKEATEVLKSKIAEIFIHEGRLGIFGDGLTGSEFIQVMTKFLVAEHSDLTRLRQGFQIINDFHLSYSGLIEPQIYQNLEGFNNIKIENDPNDITTLSVDQNTSPEFIFNALKVDYERTVSKIKAALEELVIQPSIAAYARTEKFLDNVIYHKEAQRNWRKFLRRVRDKVWIEEIGQLEAQQQVYQQWLSILNQLKELNSVDTIKSLN